MSSQITAPRAFTELVPSTTVIQPGKPFQIALHMKMAPGWHSYFINPGESGMATRIAWHLPPGFSAGPIRWPKPKRVVIDTVTGYVYENEVWLVSDIEAPRVFRHRTGPITVSANVSWLLCQRACVPQKSSLRLSLSLSGPARPNPAFAPALKTLPQSGVGMNLAAFSSDKDVTLYARDAFAPSAQVQFFPGDPTYFGAELPQVQSTPAGISVTVPLSRYAPSSPKRLTGILVVPPTDGPGGGAHWIDVQVTKR